MIRQGLDADSAYVDVALHGDGLTSLQFRDAKGDRHARGAGERLGAEAAPASRRRGSTSGCTWPPRATACSSRARPCGSTFRGAVLRRHRRLRAQQGRDREGGLLERRADRAARPPHRGRRSLYSTLETQTIASTDRRVVSRHADADRGAQLAARRQDADLQQRRPDLPHPGRRRRRPRRSTPASPRAATTTTASRPTATLLAISDQSQGRRQSLIYTLPIDRRERPSSSRRPARRTGTAGRPTARRWPICGERGGEFDIYTIPAEGGPETRLTTAKGLDDGPEYSPDGKSIYFNSVRTGTMQIWRMRADGSEQEPVTADEFNNWFPHPSPDGRSLVFLSYEKDVTGHPENKDVTLRRMTLAEQEDRRAGPVLRRPGDDQRPVLVARRPEDRVRDLLRTRD